MNSNKKLISDLYFNPETNWSDQDPVIVNKLVEFKNAVQKNRVKEVAKILYQDPSVVNRVLDDGRNQTALFIAVANHSSEMIKLLVKNGANINHFDFDGKVAKDCTKISQRSLRKALGSQQKTNILIETALKILKMRLVNAIKLTADKPVHTQVLRACLNQIKRFKIESYAPDKLLDLHTTIQSIMLACENKDDFEKAILDFILLRKEFLRGESLDACFTRSLANQLCCQLVEIIFPQANPNDILYMDALTKNRPEIWKNVYSGSTSLPKSPADFFRTETNHIHIYDGIVARAMNFLRSDHFTKQKIWLSTDSAKDLEELTKEEVALLKQRTPTLAELVHFTEQVEDALKLNLEKRFTELSAALEKLGTPNTPAKNTKLIHRIFRKLKQDTEKLAAHKVVKNFKEWWALLDRIQMGPAIQQKLQDVNNQELGNVINFILGEIDKDTTSLAYERIARDMKPVLAAALPALRVLNAELDYRIAPSDLDDLNLEIKKELNIRHFNIHTEKNTFAKICQDKQKLQHYLVKSFGYEALISKQNKANKKSVHLSTSVFAKKPQQQLSKVENLPRKLNSPC